MSPTYMIFSPLHLTLYADGPCEDEGNSKTTISVVFADCPVGFQLSSSKTCCECHYTIQQYTQSCDIDTQSIQRLDEFWLSYTNTTNGSSTLVHVNLESPEGADAQCAFHRVGTLCGGCQDGYSLVLGSSIGARNVATKPCPCSSLYLWLE